MVVVRANVDLALVALVFERVSIGCRFWCMMDWDFLVEHWFWEFSDFRRGNEEEGESEVVVMGWACCCVDNGLV